MKKTAECDYSVSDIIKKRWSPRSFMDSELKEDDIMSLFEAARWAPSAYNEQPWRFIYATKDEPGKYGKLFSCLVKANQVWVGNAYLLCLVCAKLNYTHNNKPNRHCLHDTGLAVENFLLQAVDLGLAAHPMAGFNTDKARNEFSIPDDFEPITMIAAGIPGNPESLPANLFEMEMAPRIRKPFDEIAGERIW